MRFGIEFGSYPADIAPAEAVQQISERAQAAYKNNFEALFVAQHYLTVPGRRLGLGPAAAVEAWLSAAGLRAGKLYLETQVTENLDCARAHLGKELVHQTGGEERDGLRPGISHYLALGQVGCTLVGRFVSVGVGGGSSDRIPQRYLWNAICN